jgi:hypothetical protein
MHFTRQEGHLGDLEYDFIKRAKKYLEKHRYEVKSGVQVHQDEAFVKRIKIVI